MTDAHAPFGGGGSSQKYGYNPQTYGYSQGYQANGYYGHDARSEADQDAGHTPADPASHRHEGAPLRRITAAGMSQMAGALVSLALVVGVSVWGYQLIMRDVSGVPIVRATSEPMRIAPEVPGGSQAAHQGLAVNEIAGRGAAGGPVDALRLAPTPVDLTSEDQPSGLLQLARVDPSQGQTQTQPSAQARQAPMPQDAAIQALADQIAADVAPLTALTPQDPAASFPSAVEAQPNAAVGTARSLRPQARPESLIIAALNPSVATSESSATASLDLDPATLPVGTRLVQLGAYDSRETAEAEWGRIAARFDTFFDGKRRVIQRAESGGNMFYRLRADGFADLSDARRFCAALVAERTDCIPVVTR